MGNKTKWALRNTEFGVELCIEAVHPVSTVETEIEALRRQNAEMRREIDRLKMTEARLEHNVLMRMNYGSEFLTECSACDTVWPSWHAMRKDGGHFCYNLRHAICRFCVHESTNLKQRVRCFLCPKGSNGVQFPKNDALLELERCIEEDADGQPDPNFALTHRTIDGEPILADE